ncbi:protein of unknown function DUF1054 [Paenibacillus curdlanolyticus YK9]|uniref:UPF0637 protein PaecuDRAFT_0397 n=1 Tax=Paenibacillus curdlanolyticus YK9 TaxID=717606 RepID=E0I3M2_9BACL|nr:DUF1054 domain-containing protein [Paenibacillus curdlanolyticus]EFM12886.1 protein of unknown function DUF1054 [Paenibacillus curdlanolyticus YK9]
MTNTTILPTLPIKEAGFVRDDFNVFHLNGLDERMAAIQSRIQPKFRALGEKLTAELAPAAGGELFLHIAKHARRTVNPPKDTWMSLCENKRGYKAHPHFQLGLFDDHLFMWLAFIYELPSKPQVATTLLNHLDTVRSTVPSDYVISMDHMKKEAAPVKTMSEQDWQAALVRFRDVKSAELLIGRHFPLEEALLQDGESLFEEALKTYEALMPLYRLAVQQ